MQDSNNIEKRHREQFDYVKKFSYGTINSEGGVLTDDYIGERKEKELLLEFENMETNDETKDYLKDSDDLLDNEVFLSTEDRRESLEEIQQEVGRTMSIDRSRRIIASYLFWLVMIIFVIVLSIRVAYVDNIII